MTTLGSLGMGVLKERFSKMTKSLICFFKNHAQFKLYLFSDFDFNIPCIVNGWVKVSHELILLEFMVNKSVL